MNRKLFFKFIAIFSFVGLCIFAVGPELEAFSDVDSTTKNVDAIMDLYNRGIINGYDDGSFKPDNSITRGEVAIIISKAFDYDDTTALTDFLDVPADAWLHPYVMRVANARVMGSVGYDNFGPMQNITYDEILKIAISIMGKDDLATLLGGWPNGYSHTAQAMGLADLKIYGSSKASRADVCKVISNIFKYDSYKDIKVGSEKIEIGMDTNLLSRPDETASSTWKDTSWWFYNTSDYENFYALLVKDNYVFGLAAIGSGFEFNGKRAGDYANDNHGVVPFDVFYEDKNDGDRVHGMYTYFLLVGSEKQYQDLSGQDRAIYHFTNAFRVYHSKAPLEWDDRLATAARLHCEDMGKNNYFNHTSLDGRSPSDRVKAQGVSYGAGENISAGYAGAFEAYNGWVNSEGHRDNMLNDSYQTLGVGSAYVNSGSYQTFFTQNFSFSDRRGYWD